MKKNSKKYEAALTKIEASKVYSLDEAVKLAKETSVTKFDSSVDIKLDEAKASGAEFFGGKEMLEKIQRENWFDFDIIVATPDMMGELGKMGRLLGPKGLMPNPKTGTVTMDVKGAVADIKRGKIAYRVDKDGNLSMGIGRVSFSDADLLDNLVAITDTIAKARPSTVKGTYILKAVVTTTMGPAIPVTFAGRN